MGSSPKLVIWEQQRGGFSGVGEWITQPLYIDIYIYIPID